MAPYNGSGVFTLPFDWNLDAANGIPITSSRMMGQENDMANNGFDLCMTRDGQGAATATIPFAAGITLNGGTTINAYRENVWAPSDGSGAGLTLNIARATYVQIGSMYFCDLAGTYPTTANASPASIAGLPGTYANVSGAGGAFPITSSVSGITGIPVMNSASFAIFSTVGTVSNAQMSGATFRAQFMIFTV